MNKCFNNIISNNSEKKKSVKYSIVLSGNQKMKYAYFLMYIYNNNQLKIQIDKNYHVHIIF